MRADLPRQAEAVVPWQHEVEQHEIDPATGQAGPHGRAVGGLADAEALAEQIAREGRADPPLVVHHQNVHARRHRPSACHDEVAAR
jgi:hypothetical protein